MHSSNGHNCDPTGPDLAHAVERGQAHLYMSETFVAELLAELRKAPHTPAVAQLGRTLVAAAQSMRAIRRAPNSQTSP